MSDVSIRVIDYRALRKSYVRWRRDNPNIRAWYQNWFEFYKRFHHKQETENAPT